MSDVATVVGVSIIGLGAYLIARPALARRSVVRPSVSRLETDPELAFREIVTRVPEQRAPVFRLRMKANPGQSPIGPPRGIAEHPILQPRIAWFTARHNAASEGLDVGLNYWYRPVGAGSTLRLSQHHAALATDVQGPEQDIFAQRCRDMGLVVVTTSNSGSPYSHRHIQSEVAGELERLGFTEDELFRLQQIV